MAAGPPSQGDYRGRRPPFFHDPEAPAPEGLLPAAYAAVRDGQGRVLLVRRADDGNWELPGGRVDIGESASQTVVRAKLRRAVGVHAGRAFHRDSEGRPSGRAPTDRYAQMPAVR